MSQVIIACPNCKWKPDGRAHWYCSCGHNWNTFETRGECPACHYRWRDTQCPGPGYPGGCGAVSLHDDWYIIPMDLEEIIKESRVETVKN